MYRPCHLTSLPKLGGPRASPETRREGKVTSKHKQTSDKTQYFPVDGEPLKNPQWENWRILFPGATCLVGEGGFLSF